MNAGAYGKEIKDIIIETKCFDVEKYKSMIKSNSNEEQLKQDVYTIKLSNEEQKFSYRKSIFYDKDYIILEAKLKLRIGNKKEIQDKMNEYLENRKQKQPINMPSAGSTFKRGADFITAQIIDECGLKGYSIGDAQISNKHAGFIVNKGNATAEQILELIEFVKQTVYKKTGKKIVLEIEVLGE